VTGLRNKVTILQTRASQNPSREVVVVSQELVNYDDEIALSVEATDRRHRSDAAVRPGNQACQMDRVSVPPSISARVSRPPPCADCRQASAF
jgi:hypothetical protein